MVYLDTDKQTCADLSITESVYDEQPLCSLFLKQNETGEISDAGVDYVSVE